MTNKNLTISGVDGYPDTVYVPSKSEPELFHWRGKHWMTISKDKEGASSLRPQVWSRNRSVLDEFGQEARTFYRVRAIFVTSLLRVALGNFVTLMGIGESSSL
jgi:hypothetical protein